MADIEKVIKGLEICKNHDGSNCLECPYFIDECVDDLCADALELLKKNEAVKPLSEHHLFICQMCKKCLYREQKYCDECGQAVKWE